MPLIVSNASGCGIVTLRMLLPSVSAINAAFIAPVFDVTVRGALLNSTYGWKMKTGISTASSFKPRLQPSLHLLEQCWERGWGSSITDILPKEKGRNFSAPALRNRNARAPHPDASFLTENQKLITENLPRPLRPSYIRASPAATTVSASPSPQRSRCTLPGAQAAAPVRPTRSEDYPCAGNAPRFRAAIG